MKVKCLFSNSADPGLPKVLVDYYKKEGYDSNYNIIVGKEYTVYAMTFHIGYPWYYIYDELDRGYPLWHPGPMFEVTDNRLSKYWIYSVLFDKESGCDAFFAYPEWANNLAGYHDDYYVNYYDALSDGEKSAVAIFEKYKTLMDSEFKF